MPPRKCLVRDSGTNNNYLNSVHSPAAVSVRNCPLSLVGGITLFVSIVNTSCAVVWTISIIPFISSFLFSFLDSCSECSDYDLILLTLSYFISQDFHFLLF